MIIAKDGLDYLGHGMCLMISRGRSPAACIIIIYTRATRGWAAPMYVNLLSQGSWVDGCGMKRALLRRSSAATRVMHGGSSHIDSGNT